MKKKGETILGVLFVVWFIGTLIGTLIVSRSEELKWLIPVLFGQMFFICGAFGAYSIYKQEKKLPWIGGVLMAIGAGALTYGFANHFGSDETRTTMEKLFPILFGVVFLGVGLCGLIGTVTYKKRREGACLTPVEGTCIGFEETLISGRLMRSAVFQYTWNGEQYTVNSGTFTKAFPNFGSGTKVGEVRTLYIDENNPDSFYEPKSGRAIRIILYVLFTLFALAGAAILYLCSTGVIR